MSASRYKHDTITVIYHFVHVPSADAPKTAHVCCFAPHEVGNTYKISFIAPQLPPVCGLADAVIYDRGRVSLRPVHQERTQIKCNNNACTYSAGRRNETATCRVDHAAAMCRQRNSQTLHFTYHTLYRRSCSHTSISILTNCTLPNVDLVFLRQPTARGHDGRD